MVYRNISTLIGALALGFAAMQASADTVSLVSIDQTVTVTGELQGFDGEAYTIATAIGNITIPIDKVSCIGEACPDLGPVFSEFTISGSRDLALNLMPDLLDGFGASLGLEIVHITSPNGDMLVKYTTDTGEEVADINFVMEGSSQGMRNLLQGSAAMALTTRPARADEVTAIRAAGFGDILTPGLENVIALDGIVIVTAANNPVRVLTEANIARVFSGAVTNWAELGGPNAPINLYGRAENTGTGSVFSQLIMNPARARVSRNAQLLDSDAAVSDAVSGDRYGIGFTSNSNVHGGQTLAIQGECGIQAPATAFTIKTEEYPFSRRMFLYRTARNESPLVEQFVEYLGTVEAQSIIARTGFVDQSIATVDVNGQGLRFLAAVLPTNDEVDFEQIQAMMIELNTAQRLTSTFRFEQGSATLDSRAEGDILRMARRIAEGNYESRKIILVGFTDSVGDGGYNLRLSNDRATQVRDALLANIPTGMLNNVEFEVLGFGELSPLGCNEDLKGRNINRRVEVWVR